MLRAAWRSVLGRKLRLLMSTFAIILGVAFVAGTLIFTDTLQRSFTAIFDNSVGDVVVTPKGAESASAALTLRVPATVVTRLATLPGAARADGKVVVPGVFVVGKDNKLVGGNGPPGLGLGDSTAPAAGGVRPLSVVQGTRPRGAGEVALDKVTAKRAGYYLGETVTLVNAGSRALIKARLVGLADFPDGGSLNGATAALFDTRAAQGYLLDGRDEFNDVWVTARPGVSQQQLKAQVSTSLETAGLSRSYTVQTGAQAAKASASRLLKAIDFITVFLLVFAGIALVVGSFLIVNTFSMLVAQRSRELALLRAVGASRRQVTLSVLFEALVVGVAGSTLGLGLGYLLAVGIRALFGRFGLDLSGTPLVWQLRTPLAAYAVGVLVTLVAAYLPARRASAVPPVAALRDDVAMPESSLVRRFVLGVVMVLAGIGCGATGLFTGVSNSGYWVGAGALLAMLGVASASPVLARPFLLVAVGTYRRLFGSVGLLAGHNAQRNPRRTAATASALMIGLTLVTTMTIAGASAKASVDAAVNKAFVGDLVISNAVGEGFSPQIARMAAREPGVQSVTPLRFGAAKLGTDRVYPLGVDPRNLGDVLRLDVVRGSLNSLGVRDLAISKTVAADKHLGLGDSVRLRFPAGVQVLRVTAVYDSDVGSGYLVDSTVLATGGYTPQDATVLIKLQPGVDAAAVRDQLDKATAKLPTVTVKDQRAYAAEQRGPIDQLVTMIYALLGLALLIAVLGVVNTLGLSVIERTREIGLLRAVGLSRRQLRRMVSLESVAIALLGALLGVGMGVAFGAALMASLRSQGLEVTVIPVGSLVGYLLAAVVIGLLAAVVPARRAAKLDVLRAIATE